MSSRYPIIDSLREKGWTLADSQQHPLGRLQGKGLGAYKLVSLLGAKKQ